MMHKEKYLSLIKNVIVIILIHDNIREVMLIPVINHATSVLGGFAIFSVIGFIAEQTGSTVDEVITSG